MRAIVLEGPRRAVVRDIAEPSRAPGEVLIAVERAGICGSDVAVFSGSRSAAYPLVMGHEAVGRIADAGESDHAPNTRVVIEPNIPCGRCEVCRGGHGNVCPHKRSLGMNSPGVFAELVAVPADFVHPLPEDVRSEDAVGIEPLAVALHAVAAAAIAEGDDVTVIGCGAEGLLLVQVLVARGVRVTAADLRADRLERARQVGAEALVRVSGDSAEGLSAPIVFEAAGASPALELALHAVAPGGRVIALGLATAPAELLPHDFVRRGLTLVGSLIYDHPTDFQLAINQVQGGHVQPSALVSRVVDGLEEVPLVLNALTSDDPGGKTVVAIRSRV